MPVRKTRSVEEQSSLELQRWRIFQTDAGTRHFVGCNPAGWTGRVSSAIDRLDVSVRRGVTVSGRVYQLRGPSAFHPDAEYVWLRWCAINKVASFNDVTSIEFPEAGDDDA